MSNIRPSHSVAPVAAVAPAVAPPRCDARRAPCCIPRLISNHALSLSQCPRPDTCQAGPAAKLLEAMLDVAAGERL